MRVSAPRVPSCFATGLVALDILRMSSDEDAVRYRAGGTAGNVAAILGALGWSSALAGPGEESTAFSLMRADLMRCNVNYHAVLGAAVPVIVQELSATSEHRFLFHCPQCGGTLPRYRRTTMQSLAGSSAGFGAADVFFTDRLSEDVLELAMRAHAHGAFVVYEPSDPEDAPWLAAMLPIADMVKWSSERAANLPELGEQGDYLEVQTLGPRGVRWRWARSGQPEWRALAAARPQRVIDTCGAGDWLTSGILIGLSRMAFRHERSTGDTLAQVLDRAQRLAAWSCGFAGARGALYGAGPAAAFAAMNELATFQSAWGPLPESGDADSDCVVCPR